MPEGLLDGLWSLEGHWRGLGDVHDVLPRGVAGLIVTLAAVACGTLIGAERERREKPAGVRTLVLICVGSVIFTQASLILGGGRADPARIAAQVVTGVGFLGAGAIIQQGGHVVGVTTGAAIWAVAAIGVVLGAGYVAAGIAFTFVVLLTLMGIRRIENAIGGVCEWREVTLTVAHDGGRTLAIIESIVEPYGASVVEASSPDAEGACDVRIRYCRSHANHKAVWQALAHVPVVSRNQRASVTQADPKRQGETRPNVGSTGVTQR